MYESCALEKKEEEALEAQSQIGWKEATLGLLSRYWLVIVIMLWYVWSRSIRLEHGNRKDETCISAIYYHYTRIWKARNGVLHSNTTMMHDGQEIQIRTKKKLQSSRFLTCWSSRMLSSYFVSNAWLNHNGTVLINEVFLPWVIILLDSFCSNHLMDCSVVHSIPLLALSSTTSLKDGCRQCSSQSMGAESDNGWWLECPLTSNILTCVSLMELLAREGPNEPRISADNTNSYHFACSVSIERRIDSSVSIGRRIWRAAPFCIQPT